jgi:hypothetical protein
VMLSITTTAHSVLPAEKPPRRPWPQGRSSYWVGLAIVLMWLGLRVFAGRIPRFAPQFLLASLLVIAAGLIACGGGSGPATPVNLATGTPAGTYPIVVTATSGSGSLSSTVTLTVM